MILKTIIILTLNVFPQSHCRRSGSTPEVLKLAKSCAGADDLAFSWPPPQ